MKRPGASRSICVSVITACFQGGGRKTVMARHQSGESPDFAGIAPHVDCNIVHICPWLEVSMSPSAPEQLESYLGGRWSRGEGVETELVDPVTGDVLATVGARGLD